VQRNNSADSLYHFGELRNAVVKIIELVGSSTKDWEDATKELRWQKRRKQSKTSSSIYVKRCNAKVEKNKIVEYRAVVKIAFLWQREK